MPPLAHHIAELQGTTVALEQERWQHEQRRAAADSAAGAGEQAIAAVQASIANSTAARDQRANEVTAVDNEARAAAARVGAAQAARAAAEQSVQDSLDAEPERPEPNAHGATPGLPAWRIKHKKWQDAHARVVANAQAAANAVVAAQNAYSEGVGRLGAAQTALAQANDAVAAAWRALEAAISARDAARASSAAEAAAIAALQGRIAAVVAQRDHYATIAGQITGDPLDRPAVEASADELAALLWGLRRQRTQRLAERGQAGATLADLNARRAGVWETFRQLRVELDAEFGFERSQATPDASVGALAAALAAADARVNATAAALDQIAAKVRTHGE